MVRESQAYVTLPRPKSQGQLTRRVIHIIGNVAVCHNVLNNRQFRLGQDVSGVIAWNELRQRFVNETVPQARYLGLEVPDENLTWNEDKQGWDFSEPDWSEFFDVIKGNGPCNTDRLAARNKAWDDGKWVRDAMLEHARKQAARRIAAE